MTETSHDEVPETSPVIQIIPASVSIAYEITRLGNPDELPAYHLVPGHTIETHVEIDGVRYNLAIEVTKAD